MLHTGRLTTTQECTLEDEQFEMVGFFRDYDLPVPAGRRNLLVKRVCAEKLSFHDDTLSGRQTVPIFVPTPEGFSGHQGVLNSYSRRLEVIENRLLGNYRAQEGYVLRFDYESVGRRFESFWAHHQIHNLFCTPAHHPAARTKAIADLAYAGVCTVRRRRCRN